MKRSQLSADAPFKAAQRSRLARIRRVWAALGNKKFKGKPNEELEYYFHSLMANAIGRVEDIVDAHPGIKTRAKAQLKLFYQELKLCDKIAQYFWTESERSRRRKKNP